LRRTVLLLAAVMLMVSMGLIGALSSFAKEDPPPEAPPFTNTTDEPSFDNSGSDGGEDTTGEAPPEAPPFANTTSEPAAAEPSTANGSGQEAPLCAPEWLQEWHELWLPVEDGWYGWWYFLWYQRCYTSKDGWYKSYDGLGWGDSIGWWEG
jgi:hypothetical protein